MGNDGNDGFMCVCMTPTKIWVRRNPVRKVSNVGRDSGLGFSTTPCAYWDSTIQNTSSTCRSKLTSSIRVVGVQLKSEPADGVIVGYEGCILLVCLSHQKIDIFRKYKSQSDEFRSYVHYFM